MTLIRRYYCDYCNTRQNDDADEGVAVETGNGFPVGWWEVPRKGPNETVGHACPHCVLQNGEAQRDIKERRDADTLRMATSVEVED